MKSKTIDIWEKTVNNPPQGYKQYFKIEKDYLIKNISNDALFLDIGSGAGRTIKEICTHVKEAIGVDNDPEAIEYSKKVLKGIPNVNVFLEDAENTHFNNNSFDIIFIGLTFCNFGDTKFSVLSEIKRILKDDGKFIFSVFNENALGYRERAYKEYEGGYTIVDKKKGSVEFNKNKAISEQFSEDEIRDIVKRAGFRINEILKGEMYYLLSCSK